MPLHNRKSKEELKELLMAEEFKRITLSFYRYVYIEKLSQYRDTLYIRWSQLGIFGRTYVAKEGINAQISIPEHNFEAFKADLEADQYLTNMPLKIAIEDDGKSFYKLIVRKKTKIVADGLNDETFDVTNVGTHLSAEEWNKNMEDPHAVIIDMRNHYESEIGHFEGAICPDADTFADELAMIPEILERKKNPKVMLYCTGGIRCEKASAYIKHLGYEDVHQLHGGIIDYERQAKQKDLPIKFRGKNFVFDERRGERITDEVISECHQCGEPCDDHTNCKNDACHLLFIQCKKCQEKFEGCCTPKCQEVIHLPREQQKELRRGENNSPGVYKSRLRPKLQEIIKRTQD